MQLFINNWFATLTAAAAPGDSQLVIAAEQSAQLTGLVGYLNGGYYAVTAVLRDESGTETAWEVLYVVSSDDGTLTVQRGQEGTAALDLPLGTEISARLTAGSLAGIVSDLHAIGRFAQLPNTSQLPLAAQEGAFNFSPLTNAAELLFDFNYANIDQRALNISIDMYSADSGQPFDLSIPTGWGLLCDLPAGSAIAGTGEAPYVITLPAAEAYFIEIQGIDFVRMSIRTNDSYQTLQ